jgi:hypothetical protein
MVNPVNSSLSRNDVSTIMGVSMGRRERRMTPKHGVSRRADADDDVHTERRGYGARRPRKDCVSSVSARAMILSTIETAFAGESAAMKARI